MFWTQNGREHYKPEPTCYNFNDVAAHRPRVIVVAELPRLRDVTEKNLGSSSCLQMIIDFIRPSEGSSI